MTSTPTGYLRSRTRASNLATPKRDADAIIRKMAEAVLDDVVRADAERGQVIRDAVAKAEGVQS